MKELTIEEKAKAYDKRLAKARKEYSMHEANNAIGIMDALERVFPELKEIEDEKIRKELISFFTERAKYTEDSTFNGLSSKEIIDWLEKQGEQKFEQKFFINDKVVHKATGKIWTIHYYLKDTNSYYVEDNDGLLHHYRESELKLVEQKPYISDEALREGIGKFGITQYQIDYWLKKHINIITQKPIIWNEEDDRNRQELIQFFESLRWSIATEERHEENKRWLNWLKSLKERIQPQPKQEWSEEDKIHYSKCLQYLESISPRKEDIEWFKSLRPQKHWKPCDYELEVLRLAAEKDGTCLMGLYEQLKKLREE